MSENKKIPDVAYISDDEVALVMILKRLKVELIDSSYDTDQAIEITRNDDFKNLLIVPYPKEITRYVFRYRFNLYVDQKTSKPTVYYAFFFDGKLIYKRFQKTKVEKRE